MKLFLPQSTLEQWVLDEKADLRDGKLHVTGEGRAHPAEEAFHVRSVTSGEDTARLLSRVKTHAQLDALGAERMGDSLLLGETAYEGVAGYLTEVPATTSKRPAVEKPEEQALLEALFLNKL